MHNLEKTQTHAGRLVYRHTRRLVYRSGLKKMRPKTYVHLCTSFVIQQFLEWSKTL